MEASEIYFIRNFNSNILGNKRDLAIYLPPSYKGDAQVSYPVLYMQDGQNLFTGVETGSESKWQVKETADRLIKEGKLEEIIIVGIYNTEDRIDEYTQSYMDKYKAGGKGETYARFIVEELKPYIDNSFRTLREKEHTAIAGSSLGGLIAFYIGWNYDNIFNKIGAMSPSFWWNNCEILDEIRRYSGSRKELEVWIDAGDAEDSSDRNNNGIIDMVDDARDMVNCLVQKGFKEQKDLEYYEVLGGIHHETAWALRFDRVLLYMFGRNF